MNAAKKDVLTVAGGLAAAALVYFVFLADAPKPAPVPSIKPAPVCPGPDCPSPKKPDRRPWAGSDAARAVAFALHQTPNTKHQTPDAEPMVDLLAMPSQLRPHNISSKGAGCCTFRSAEYAARWQNVPALFGLPEWMKSQGIAGGGTPSKQAAMVERISKARNLPTPRFAQYEGNDLSFIELVLKTGRVACVTWGGNHMLNCVHLDGESAAILDNNMPDKVQWFSRETFKRKHTMGGGGWVFVLLANSPPPPPRNLRPPVQSLPCGKSSCKCGCNDGEPCRCAAFAAKCPHGCSPECTCGCNDGRPCKCCPDCPDDDEPEGAGGDGGLEWEYGGRERFLIGSVEVTRAEVEEALEDDSNRLHLTVAGGSDAERKAVLDAAGDQAGRYLVQSYAADAWELQCGFAVGSVPTVYLQDRDGKVLLRAEGAERLAEKLRRADPSYQPNADPSGDAVAGDAVHRCKQWAKDNPLLALGGSGAAALLALWWRSKGGPTTAVAPAPAARPASQDEVQALLRQLLDRLPPRAP